MNARQFFDLVCTLRVYQRAATKLGDYKSIAASRRLENIVDDEIARVERIMAQQASNQTPQE